MSISNRDTSSSTSSSSSSSTSSSVSTLSALSLSAAFSSKKRQRDDRSDSKEEQKKLSKNAKIKYSMKDLMSIAEINLSLDNIMNASMKSLPPDDLKAEFDERMREAKSALQVMNVPPHSLSDFILTTIIARSNMKIGSSPKPKGLPVHLAQLSDAGCFDLTHWRLALVKFEQDDFIYDDSSDSKKEQKIIPKNAEIKYSMEELISIAQINLSLDNIMNASIKSLTPDDLKAEFKERMREAKNALQRINLPADSLSDFILTTIITRSNMKIGSSPKPKNLPVNLAQLFDAGCFENEVNLSYWRQALVKFEKDDFIYYDDSFKQIWTLCKLKAISSETISNSAHKWSSFGIFERLMAQSQIVSTHEFDRFYETLNYFLDNGFVNAEIFNGLSYNKNYRISLFVAYLINEHSSLIQKAMILDAVVGRKDRQGTPFINDSTFINLANHDDLRILYDVLNKIYASDIIILKSKHAAKRMLKCLEDYRSRHEALLPTTTLCSSSSSQSSSSTQAPAHASLAPAAEEAPAAASTTPSVTRKL